MKVKNSKQLILEKEFNEYCQNFPDLLRAKDEYANVSVEEIEKIFQKYENINNSLDDSDFFKAKPGEYKKILKDSQSGTSYKKILNSTQNEIEKTIKKMDYMFDKIPYLDEFPTGEFNAAAMKSNKVKDGVIIMINTGLFEFLGGIAHFFANSIQSEDDREETTEENKARMYAIADFWNAYRKYGDSRLSKLLDMQTGPKGVVGTWLEKSCHDFVIAHEVYRRLGGLS